MTAEIGILNRHAVALAADSAVTLQLANSAKIYNSANKLFMLSKYHPVGIMVHGSAEFMNVPWETIIKIFRQELGHENYDHLEGFAARFIGFLEGNELLFPAARQDEVVMRVVYRQLNTVREQINLAVQAEIKTHGSVDQARVKSICDEKITEGYQWWKQQNSLQCFNEDFTRGLLNKYSQSLVQAASEVLEQLPLTGLLDRLKELVLFPIIKDRWTGFSGVVIAGFGKRDIFPCLHSYWIEAIFHKKARLYFQEGLSNDMNKTGQASIIPFAQREVVERFIKGVDPEYKQEFHNYLRTLLTESYPNKIVEQMREHGVADSELRDAKAALISIGRKVTEEFDSAWEGFEFQKYVSPVLDIVADLPKDELAAMAESLVNLTSFKRRITREAETVGGPIDVAVISKGDGFIWIKRKHYFEKDLNPYFFANYYGEPDEEDKRWTQSQPMPKPPIRPNKKNKSRR